MAKINLLTIHWGRSYGAIFQTYATAKLLEESGHKVTVVNLLHPRLKYYFLRLRAWFYLIMDLQFAIFKTRYFTKLTKRMYGFSANKIPFADYIVIGSDQVWNKDITSPMDLHYYIDFNDNIKKVSLASSFGKSEWTEDEKYTNHVKSLFHKFDAISVREETGQKILKNNFEVNSTLLIDPTLAYANFDNLVLNNKNKNQIFTFLFSSSEQSKQIVNAISKEKSLPVFKFNKFTFYLQNGPRHWLTRIKNSQIVITDSFHGLAFSLIFQKEFFVLCADTKKFTRLESLLKLLNLEHRFIRSLDDFNNRKKQLELPIDYTKVQQVLSIEQNKYKEFIKNNIH